MLGLKTITDVDLELLLTWRNAPETRRYMFNDELISKEQHQAWYEEKVKTGKISAFLYTQLQEPLGYVGFTPLHEGRVYEWGFYKAPSAAKGIGSKMVEVALEFAFTELKAHKIIGRVLDYNTPSQSLHERMGFIKEGDLRDQHYANGAYHSVYVYGLLESERPIRNENE